MVISLSSLGLIRGFSLSFHFRPHEISWGAHKLARTSMIIKKRKSFTLHLEWMYGRAMRIACCRGYFWADELLQLFLLTLSACVVMSQIICFVLNWNVMELYFRQGKNYLKFTYTQQLMIHHTRRNIGPPVETYI